MKELLRILFFSKTILLTPHPIDLHGRIELIPDEPIEAITNGAGIEVDVSSMIAWKNHENIMLFKRRLLSLFPPETISVKLIGENAELEMYYDGSYSFNENIVILYVEAKNGVPVGVKYNKVVVSSGVKLKHIKVYWRNYKY